MKTYQAICIDDDQQFLDSLESALPAKVEALCTSCKCVFDFVTTPAEAMEVMAAARASGTEPAMIISDQVMPGVSGIELIEKVKVVYPDLVCVLLTGHAGLDSAKYAINRRLLDQYVSKPIDDLQEFASLLANLLRGHHLGLEERERTGQLAQTVQELQVANDSIRQMQSAAEQVAMLSRNLKVLDFDEIVNIITCEVPRLFGAQWSVICMPEDGCPGETSCQTGHASRRMQCPCPQASLLERADAIAALRTGRVHCGEPMQACVNMGAATPDVVIPLSIAAAPGSQGQQNAAEKAYLCMCQIAPELRGGLGLLQYKAELVREVLSANLSNARLYQEARRHGQTDSLTSVSTRRVLESRMDAEYERSARYGHPFCIAMLDVDRFKQVNDTHGHETGDRILKEVAHLLQSQARTTDLVSRYGGDEFVLLMPETSLEDGQATAERICRGARAIVLPDGSPLTISVGLAQWTQATTEPVAEVLRRADAALYEAKRGGRDRTAVSAA